MSEDERIALAEEADSLPLHVKMCALRHNQVLGKISAADKRLRRIEAAAWAILTAVGGGGAFTLSQILPAVRALAGQ